MRARETRIATRDYCCTVHDIFYQFFMATAERITLDQVSDIENFTVLRLNTFGGMRGAHLERRWEATAIPSMATGAYKIAATDIAVTVVTITDGTEWLSGNSGKQWLFPLQ